MDAQLTFIPTFISFQDWQSQYLMEYSSVTQELPINIHLLTLEDWITDSKNRILLRLEHFFEAQEDPEGLSKPVDLDLQGLFKTFDIENMEEVILGMVLK